VVGYHLVWMILNWNEKIWADMDDYLLCEFFFLFFKGREDVGFWMGWEFFGILVWSDYFHSDRCWCCHCLLPFNWHCPISKIIFKKGLHANHYAIGHLLCGMIFIYISWFSTQKDDVTLISSVHQYFQMGETLENLVDF
jgi:hypothetical protein